MQQPTEYFPMSKGLMILLVIILVFVAVIIAVYLWHDLRLQQLDQNIEHLQTLNP